MKAPDKIYVREYPDGIALFWESKKKEDVVATVLHEYIRKDTAIIEGEVVKLTDTYEDFTVSVEGKELNEVLQTLGVKDGDKVKVIIVKEGEE